MRIFVSDKTERLRVQMIRSKLFVDFLIQDYKDKLTIEAYKQIGEHEDFEKDVSYKHGEQDGYVTGKAKGEEEKDLEWQRRLPVEKAKAVEEYKEQERIAKEERKQAKKWIK